jgi:hypothetical protein
MRSPFYTHIQKNSRKADTVSHMMRPTRWHLYVFLTVVGLSLMACASVPSPEAITLLQDDFSESELDHTRWTVGEGEAGVSVEQGQLVLAGLTPPYGHKDVDSTLTFVPDEQALTAKARIQLTGDYQKFGFGVNASGELPAVGINFDTMDRANPATGGREHAIHLVVVERSSLGGPVRYVLNVETPVSWYTFHEFEITWTSSTISFKIDGERLTQLRYPATRSLPVGLWNDRAQRMQVDWVKVVGDEP